MTLQEVTLAHSRRLSNLHKRRDSDLRDAVSSRDVRLRGMAATGPLYEQLDVAVTKAADAKDDTVRRAAVARANVQEEASETRSEAHAKAHQRRKAADLSLLEKRIAAESAAEKDYRDAIAAIEPTAGLEHRQVTAQEAGRKRRVALEAAKVDYVSAIAQSQSEYRNDVDGALANERAAERLADTGYGAAVRVAEASYTSAVTAAERALMVGLRRLPDAVATLDDFNKKVATIRTEVAAEEARLFDRFRDEIKAIGH